MASGAKIAVPSTGSDRRYAQSPQILKRPVVELRLARSVVVIAGRHEDDHALPSSREQHAVGVQQVLFPFRLVDLLPLVASEGVVFPTAGPMQAQVGVPGHADPVELKSLDLKFGGGVLEVVARPGVETVVQE